jgi:formylglycine-generating enzyme required for sulfatase activity
MGGNVLEWVSDWYSEDYYKNSLKDNPHGPETGTSKIIRGGSWYSKSEKTRVSYRNWFHPEKRDYTFGFRLAHDIK